MVTLPIFLSLVLEYAVQPVLQKLLKGVFPDARVKLSLKGGLFCFRDIVVCVQAIDPEQERSVDVGLNVGALGLETTFEHSRLVTRLYIRDICVQGSITTNLLQLVSNTVQSRGTPAVVRNKSGGISTTVLHVIGILSYYIRCLLQWCLFDVIVERLQVAQTLQTSSKLSDTMEYDKTDFHKTIHMKYPLVLSLSKFQVTIDPSMDDITVNDTYVSQLVPSNIQIHVGEISLNMLQPYMQTPLHYPTIVSESNILTRYKYAKRVHAQNVEYTAKYLNKAEMLPSRFRPQQQSADGYCAEDALHIGQFQLQPILLGLSMQASVVKIESRKMNASIKYDIPVKSMSIHLGSVDITGHTEGGSLGLGMLLANIQHNLPAPKLPSVVIEEDSIPVPPHLPCEEQDWAGLLRRIPSLELSITVGGVSVALTSPFITSSLEHARLAPNLAVPFFATTGTPCSVTLIQNYIDPYSKIFKPSVFCIVLGELSITSPGIKTQKGAKTKVLPVNIQLGGIHANNTTFLPKYNLVEALSTLRYTSIEQQRGVEVSDMLAIPHISVTCHIRETPKQKKPIQVCVTAGIAPLHVCISSILGSWLRQISHSILAPITRLDDLTDAYISAVNNAVATVKCAGCDKPGYAHSKYCSLKSAMSIHTVGAARLPVDTVHSDLIVYRDTQSLPSVFSYFIFPAPAALLEWRIKRQFLLDAKHTEESLDVPHLRAGQPGEVNLKVGQTPAETALLGAGVPLQPELTTLDAYASRELQDYSFSNTVQGQISDYRDWMSTNKNDIVNIVESSMYTKVHPYEYTSFATERINLPFELSVTADLHAAVITAYACSGHDTHTQLHNMYTDTEGDAEYLLLQELAELNGIKKSTKTYSSAHASKLYLPHQSHPTFMKLYHKEGNWEQKRTILAGYHKRIPLFPPTPVQSPSQLFVFVCEQTTIHAGAPLQSISKEKFAQCDVSASTVIEPHLKYSIQKQSDVVIEHTSNLPFIPTYSGDTVDLTSTSISIPTCTRQYGGEAFSPTYIFDQCDPNFIYDYTSEDSTASTKVLLPIDRDPLHGQFVLAQHVTEVQLRSVTKTHMNCLRVDDLHLMKQIRTVQDQVLEQQLPLDRSPAILSTKTNPHTIVRLPLATYSLALSPLMMNPVCHPTFAHAQGPGMVILAPVVILNLQAIAFRNAVELAGMIVTSAPALSPFGKAMLEPQPLWNRVELATLGPLQAGFLQNKVMVELSSRPTPHEFVHIRLGGQQVHIPSYQPLPSGALTCDATNEFSMLTNSVSLSIDTGTDEWVMSMRGIAMHRDEHCFMTIPCATLRGGEKIFRSLRVSVVRAPPSTPYLPPLPPAPLTPSTNGHLYSPIPPPPPPLSTPCQLCPHNMSTVAEEQLVRSLLLTEAAARVNDLLASHPSLPNDSAHAYTRCKKEMLLPYPSTTGNTPVYSQIIHQPGRPKYMAVRSIDARWVCSFALADRIFKSIDHYAAVILNVKYQIYAMKRPFCPRMLRHLTLLHDLPAPVNNSFSADVEPPSPMYPLPPQPSKITFPVALLSHPVFLSLLSQHSTELLQSYTKWLLRDRAPWLDEEYYHVVLDSTDTQVEFVIPLSENVKDDEYTPNIKDFETSVYKPKATDIPVRVNVGRFQSYALPHHFSFTNVTVTPYNVPIPLIQVQQVLVERSCIYPAMMNSYHHDYAHMQCENADMNMTFTGVVLRLSNLTTIAATIPHTLHRIHDLLTQVEVDTPSVHKVSQILGGPGYQHQPAKIAPGVNIKMTEIQILFLEDPLEVWTTKIHRLKQQHKVEMVRKSLLLKLYCQTLVEQARNKDLEKVTVIVNTEADQEVCNQTTNMLKSCSKHSATWRNYRQESMNAYELRKKQSKTVTNSILPAQLAARSSLNRCKVYGDGFDDDLPRLVLYEELMRGNTSVKHEDVAQMKCLSLQNDQNQLDSSLWVKKVNAYYTAKEGKARRYEESRRTALDRINVSVLQDIAAQTPTAKLLIDSSDILTPDWDTKTVPSQGILLSRALAVHREACKTAPYVGGYFSAAPYQLAEEQPHYSLLPYAYTQPSLTDNGVRGHVEDMVPLFKRWDTAEPTSMMHNFSNIHMHACLKAFHRKAYKDPPYFYPTYQFNKDPSRVSYCSHYANFLASPRVPENDMEYIRGVAGVHWWPGARMTVSIHAMDVRSSSAIPPSAKEYLVHTPVLPFPSHPSSTPGFVCVRSDPTSWRNPAFAKHQLQGEIASLLASPISVGTGAVHAIANTIDANDTIHSLLTPWAGNYIKVSISQTQVHVTPSIQPVVSIDVLNVDGSMQVAAYHSIRLHPIIAPVPFHVFMKNKVALHAITVNILPMHIFSIRKQIPLFIALIPPIPHPSLLASLLRKMAPFDIPSSWSAADYITLARTLLYMSMDVEVHKIHTVLLAAKHKNNSLQSSKKKTKKHATASVNYNSTIPPTIPSIPTPMVPVHMSDTLEMNPWYDYEGWRLPCSWLLPIDQFAMQLYGVEYMSYLATALRSRKHWRDRTEDTWDARNMQEFHTTESLQCNSRRLRLWNMNFWGSFVERQSILASIVGTHVTLDTSMVNIRTDEFIVTSINTTALQSTLSCLAHRYAGILGVLRGNSTALAEKEFLGSGNVNNNTMLGVEVLQSDVLVQPTMRVPHTNIELQYHWVHVHSEMQPDAVPVSEFDGECVDVEIYRSLKSIKPVPSVPCATTTQLNGCLETLTLNIPTLQPHQSFIAEIAEFSDDQDDDDHEEERSSMNILPLHARSISPADSPNSAETVQIAYPKTMLPPVANLSQSVLHIYMCMSIAQPKEEDTSQCIDIYITPATMEFLIHNAAFYVGALVQAPRAPGANTALVGIRCAGIAVENQEDSILYLVNSFNDQLDSMQTEELFSIKETLSIFPRIPINVPLRSKQGKEAVLPSPLAPQMESNISLYDRPGLTRAFSFSSYSSLDKGSQEQGGFFTGSWRSFCLRFGSLTQPQILVGNVSITVAGAADNEDSHALNILVESTSLSLKLVDVTLLSERVLLGPWIEPPRVLNAAPFHVNIDPQRYISDWALAVPQPSHAPSSIPALQQYGKVQDAASTPFPSLGLENTLTYLRNANLLVPLPPLCITNLPDQFTKQPVVKVSSVYSQFYQITSKLVPQQWSKWIKEAFAMYIRKNAKQTDFHVPYQTFEQTIAKLVSNTMAELHQLLPHLDLPANLDGCKLPNPAYGATDIHVSIVNVSVQVTPTTALATKKRKEIDMHRVLLNPNSRTVVIYQYQRRFAGTFLSTHRLPTDRPEWGGPNGEPWTKDGFQLCHSTIWEWESDWEIDLTHLHETDREGWQYAVDYPRSYQKDRGWLYSVRRRRWIRTMRQKPGITDEKYIYHPDFGYVNASKPCKYIETNIDGCIQQKEEEVKCDSHTPCDCVKIHTPGCSEILDKRPLSFLQEYHVRNQKLGKRVLDPESTAHEHSASHSNLANDEKNTSKNDKDDSDSEVEVDSLHMKKPPLSPLGNLHKHQYPHTQTCATPRGARVSSYNKQESPNYGSPSKRHKLSQYPVFIRPESAVFTMKQFNLLQRPLASIMPDLYEQAHALNQTWVTLACTQAAFFTHLDAPASLPFVGKAVDSVILYGVSKSHMEYDVHMETAPPALLSKPSLHMMSPRAPDGDAVKNTARRLSMFTFKEPKIDFSLDNFYNTRVNVLSQFIRNIYSRTNPVIDFYALRDELPHEVRKQLPNLKVLPFPETTRQSTRLFAQHYTPIKGFLDSPTLPNIYTTVNDIRIHVTSYVTQSVTELSSSYFKELSNAESINSQSILIQLTSFQLHRHVLHTNEKTSHEIIETQYKEGGCGQCGGTGVVPLKNRNSPSIKDTMFALRNTYMMVGDASNAGPSIGNFASVLTSSVGSFVRKLASPQLRNNKEVKDMIIGHQPEDVSTVFADMPGLSQHVVRSMGIIFAEGIRHKSAVHNKREATLAPSSNGFAFIPTTHVMCTLCRSKPGTPFTPDTQPSPPSLSNQHSSTSEIQDSVPAGTPPSVSPAPSLKSASSLPSTASSGSSSTCTSPTTPLVMPSYLPSLIPQLHFTVSKLQIQIDITNTHALPYTSTQAVPQSTAYGSQMNKKGRLVIGLDELEIVLQGHFRAPIALVRPVQPAVRKRALSLFRTASRSMSKQLLSPRTTMTLNMSAIPEIIVSESAEEQTGQESPDSFEIPAKMLRNRSKQDILELPQVHSDLNPSSFTWNVEQTSQEPAAEDICVNGVQFSKNVTVAESIDGHATMYVLPSALQKVVLAISLKDHSVSLCPGDVDISYTSIWLDCFDKKEPVPELNSENTRLRLNTSPLRTLFSMPQQSVQVDQHPYAPLFSLSTNHAAMTEMENMAKSALHKSGVIMQEQQRQDGDTVVQSNTPLVHSGDGDYNTEWYSGLIANMANRAVGQYCHPTLISLLPKFVVQALACEHKHWNDIALNFMPPIPPSALHITGPVRNPYLDHSLSKHSVRVNLPQLSVTFAKEDLWLVISMLGNVVKATESIHQLRDQLEHLCNTLSGDPVESETNETKDSNSVPISEDITSGVYPTWLHNAFFTPNAAILPPAEHAHLFTKAVKLYKLKAEKKYISSKDSTVSPNIKVSLSTLRDEMTQMSTYFENIVGAKLTQRQKLQKINTKSLLGLKDAEAILSSLTPLSPSALLLLAQRLKKVYSVVKRRLNALADCLEIDLPSQSMAGQYVKTADGASSSVDAEDNITMYTDELMGPAQRDLVHANVVDDIVTQKLMNEKIQRAERRRRMTQHEDIAQYTNTLQQPIHEEDSFANALFGHTPLYIPKLAASTLSSAAHIHLLSQLPVCRQNNVYENTCQKLKNELNLWMPSDALVRARSEQELEYNNTAKAPIGRYICCGCIVLLDGTRQLCKNTKHCVCSEQDMNLQDSFGNASPAVDLAKTAAIQLGRLFNTTASLTLIRQCVAVVTLYRCIQLQYAHATAAATLFIKAAKKSHKNSPPPLVALEDALDSEKHVFFIHGKVGNPIQENVLGGPALAAPSAPSLYTAENGLQDGSYVQPVSASRWSPFINIHLNVELGHIHVTVCSENQPWLDAKISGLGLDVILSNSISHTASINFKLQDLIVADQLISKQAELDMVEQKMQKEQSWFDLLRSKPRDKKDWIYIVSPLKRDEKAPLQSVTVQVKLQLVNEQCQGLINEHYNQWVKAWGIRRRNKEAMVTTKRRVVSVNLFPPEQKSLLQLTSTLLKPNMSAKWTNILKSSHHAAILAQAQCPQIGPLGDTTMFIPTAPNQTDITNLPMPSYEKLLLPSTIPLLPRIEVQSIVDLPVASVVQAPLLIRASRFTISRLIDVLTEPVTPRPKCVFPSNSTVLDPEMITYNQNELRKQEVQEATVALINTDNFLPEHSYQAENSAIWMGWTNLDSQTQYDDLPQQLKKRISVSAEELLVYSACHPRLVSVHIHDKYNPYSSSYNTSSVDEIPAVIDTSLCCEDGLTMALAQVNYGNQGKLPTNMTTNISVLPVSSDYEPMLRSFGKVYGRKYHANLMLACGLTPNVLGEETVAVFLDETSDQLRLYDQRRSAEYVNMTYISKHLGNYSAVIATPFIHGAATSTMQNALCPILPSLQHTHAGTNTAQHEEDTKLQYQLSSPKCISHVQTPYCLPLLLVQDKQGSFTMSTHHVNLSSQLLLPASVAAAVYSIGQLIVSKTQLQQFQCNKTVLYYGVSIPADILTQLLRKAVCREFVADQHFLTFEIYTNNPQQIFTVSTMLQKINRHVQQLSDTKALPKLPNAPHPWTTGPQSRKLVNLDSIKQYPLRIALLVEKLQFIPTIIMLSYWGSSTLEKKHVHDLENIKIVLDGVELTNTRKTLLQWKQFGEDHIAGTIKANATTGIGQVLAYKFGLANSKVPSHVFVEQTNPQVQYEDEEEEDEDILNFYATY